MRRLGILLRRWMGFSVAHNNIVLQSPDIRVYRPVYREFAGRRHF